MRPTLLNFRAPDERTGELTKTEINKNGTKFQILEERYTNPKGTNMSKEARFPNNNFYDLGTGQSVFTGPGSYKPEISYNLLNKPQC